MSSRIAVKVYLADPARNYVTEFNGTIEDARRYFVGQELNVGTVEDHKVKCLKVEDVTNWKRYKVSFRGTTKGAAVASSTPYSVTVLAADEDGARLELYDRYEHISGFTAVVVEDSQL